MSSGSVLGPSYAPGTLPPGAAEYLTRDNPKLLDLRARYAAQHGFEHTQWAKAVLDHELEFAYFRGDNAYSWQVRGGMEETQYLLSAYYAQSIDRLHLLDRLTEDSLFGAYTFTFNGRQTISRDLLDSVLQINFLDRHMRLSQLPQATVLDIGAGYGRMAWRMTRGLPNLRCIWCADAVPESTFLCDYYLRFRGAGAKAAVVPLDQVRQALRSQQIDVVTNIQSFTECTVDSIRWWLDVLATASVTYFMIVPNTPDQLLSMEPGGQRLDFQPLIEQYGYRLVVRESCYEDAPSVQRLGVYGSGKYWLFRNG